MYIYTHTHTYKQHSYNYMTQTHSYSVCTHTHTHITVYAFLYMLMYKKDIQPIKISEKWMRVCVCTLLHTYTSIHALPQTYVCIGHPWTPNKVFCIQSHSYARPLSSWHNLDNRSTKIFLKSHSSISHLITYMAVVAPALPTLQLKERLSLSRPFACRLLRGQS